MLEFVRENLFKANNIRSLKKDQTLRSRISEKRLYLFLKRGIDILFSLITVIFIMSWLVPILAIMIKLDSRGPVFFVQKRVGFLGKSFYCLKLRTMIVNSYSDDRQATADDPRITRLGRFLRITSLDELPQFLNVLIGQMSIVGPRPHMHSDNAEFGKVVENYRLRCLVKPGITGMAQIKGYRGPAKDFQKIFHRYQWDTFYFRNANGFLDFKIVRLTFIQILKSILAFKSQKKTESNTNTFIFETRRLSSE